MAQIIERRGDAQHLASTIPTPKHKSVFMSYWSTPEALAAYVGTLGDGRHNWHQGAWKNSAAFTGTSNMREAIKLCRDGWPQGAARAARFRDRINAANPIGPRVTRWDVAGAIASVPRALAGNPLNMRRVDSTRLRRKPVLTLLSDMSANCTVRSDAITNRAAVVAAVVDAIEAAGFACEIIVFSSSESGNEISQIVATTAKESSAPADIGRLAFALGHASFFRRIAWAAFTSQDFTKPLGSSLGSSARLDEQAANANGAYIIQALARIPAPFPMKTPQQQTVLRS
jgi:hypothetical protein